METIHYNHITYHIDLKTLLTRIRDGGVKYDLIIGVVRGGLIPATHLSHLLEVPLRPLVWSRTENIRDSSNPHIVTALASNKKVLVVDDIVDDGTTADGIMKAYPGIDYACLLYNTTNRYSFVPDYCGWSFSREEEKRWFNFWWEQL
jgi:uncharacterized protein